MSYNLPTNAYSHAPKLSNHLFFGSFQLLGWLFFKPTAWRYFVKRVDPNLPFDFCLTQLSWAQWHQTGLWRIFVQGYVILPLFSVFLIGLVLWLWNLIQEPTIELVSTEFIVAGSLGFSLGCSLAFGVVSSTAVGIASTVLFAIAGSVTLFQQEFNYFSVAIWGLLFGIAGNIILNIFTEKQSLSHRIGGIILGIFIGLVGTVLLITIPLSLIETTGISIAIGVLTLISVIAITLARCPINNSGYILVGLLTIIYGAVAFKAEGIAGGLAKGLVYGTLMGACIAVPYGTTHRLLAKDAGIAAAGVVYGALAIGILGGLLYISDSQAEVVSRWHILSFVAVGFLTALLGLTLSWWRGIFFVPFLLGWHTLIYRLDKQRTNEKPSLLRYHAAFWDEHQWIKLGGLHEHILLVMQKNPVEGKKALDYLKNGPQHWAVREVQVEMDIRTLERFKDINAVKNAHQKLETITQESCSPWLHRFAQISHDVKNAFKQEALYDQISSINEVSNRLNIFRRELEWGTPHAIRFIPVTETWYRIVSKHKSQLQNKVEKQQQIESPYIFAMPLNSVQKTFVGRHEIVAELENLLFEQGSSVFIHGVYRIGKTSLLMNLTGLLRQPDTVVALLVDLQGAAALGRNVTEFFSQIAEQMISYAQKHYVLSLPALSHEEELSSNPHHGFHKWLDKVQEVLAQKTLLLMFDEFAKLDEVICQQKSDYNDDILSTMRHWIQHRSRFQIVITSQRLEEFRRWPSIANNMVPRPLSYLTDNEARQLLEHPVKEFQLQYEPEATQRILELTHCHPALVQLLGREIVVLKNKQALESRFLVCLQEVEAVVPKALETGMSIFVTFEQKATAAGNTLLRYMATLGEGAIISQESLAPHCLGTLENVLEVLQQLELIEFVKTESGYRFKIELFRRWYALK
jgi:AAA+ ATPase superfamily predicted ATPase